MYVRHEQNVIDEVLALAAAGVPKLRIARTVGVNVGTVRTWVATGGVRHSREARCTEGDRECGVRQRADPAAYSYLLGQYLGDGWIDLNGRRGVYRLVIACCAAYPEIVDEVQRAIERVVPNNRVGRVPRQGVVNVQVYSTHWRCLFPQAAPGKKHERRIVLEPWQEQIALTDHPRQFLRGLVQSDGCRAINRVRGANGGRYAYPRYQFTNVSDDIRMLFVRACQIVGVETRRMNRYTIAVSRRECVALLDTFIGPKA
jgi:hypothetical protein